MNWSLLSRALTGKAGGRGVGGGVLEGRIL